MTNFIKSIILWKHRHNSFVSAASTVSSESEGGQKSQAAGLGNWLQTCICSEDRVDTLVCSVRVFWPHNAVQKSSFKFSLILQQHSKFFYKHWTIFIYLQLHEVLEPSLHMWEGYVNVWSITDPFIQQNCLCKFKISPTIFVWTTHPCPTSQNLDHPCMYRQFCVIQHS